MHINAYLVFAIKTGRYKCPHLSHPLCLKRKEKSLVVFKTEIVLTRSETFLMKPLRRKCFNI